MAGSGGNTINANLQCCYRDSVKYTLYTKFLVPKLYTYVNTGRWDKIPDRCRLHPKEALFVHKYPPYDTALHHIIRPSTGESMIRQESDDITIQQLDAIKLNAIHALLEAAKIASSSSSNNDITCVQDSFGRTTLHLACMVICNENIPLCILNANDMAATMNDNEQRTPLHLLCARNDTIPVNVLTSLINVYPDAINIKDITGDTPLDIIEIRKDEITNYDEVKGILLSSSVGVEEPSSSLQSEPNQSKLPE